MPSYIDTASLMALSEGELLDLWRTIAAEIEALPEGSEAKTLAKGLIVRIRAVIIQKRRMRAMDKPSP